MFEPIESKKLVYPLHTITSMGAQYIHSNWINFHNTQKAYSSDIKTLFSVLKDIIIQYVEEEVSFYKQAQQAYVDAVSKNTIGTVGLDEDTILENFRNVYKQQLKNENTNFSVINLIKEDLLINSRYAWTSNQVKSQKNFKQKRTYKGGGKSIEDAQKEVPNIIDGILRYLDFASGNRNLEYLTNSRYGKSKEEKLPKSLNVLTDKKRINSIKSKLKKIKTNLAAGKLTIGDVAEIQSIINELHLHSWIGLFAEDFQVELIGNFIPELITTKNLEDPNFGLLAKDYMQFNIIDVGLGSVEVDGSDVIIGLSQKFTNEELISDKSYKNQDIFDSLENFANAKMSKVDKKQKETLERMEPLFKYLRNNIIALDSFSLDSKNRDSQLIDEFIEVEVDLAILRNFLRFFNGFMRMLEDGKFQVFNPSSKLQLENPLIFNAFLAFRQEIYWILQFVKPILETIKQTGGVNREGFTANAKLKKIKNVKKSSTELWMAKRKRIKELNKIQEKISYEDLQANTFSLISSLAEEGGQLLVDSLVYTLDPAKFFKTK